MKFILNGAFPLMSVPGCMLVQEQCQQIFHFAVKPVIEWVPFCDFASLPAPFLRALRMWQIIVDACPVWPWCLSAPKTAVLECSSTRTSPGKMLWNSCLRLASQMCPCVLQSMGFHDQRAVSTIDIMEFQTSHARILDSQPPPPVK